MKARWLILCAVALVLAACGKPSAKPPLVVLAHAAVGPDALRAGLGPGASLVVQWSTDAGNAWSVATAALPTGTGPVEAVHLALPAKGDGWLLVRGKSLCVLLRSRDGGRTWSSQHQPALQSCQAAAMAFRTPSQGWIVTADGSELLIYSTPDGGQTWSPSSAPLPVSTSFTVEAIDGPVFTGARQGSFRVHYGGSASGVLGYATADGGAAWTVTTPTPTMATARLGDDEWQVDQPLSGGPLPVRRSTDGGRTWATSDIRLPANLSAPVWAHAQFVDAVHGWVLAAGAPATAQEMWVLLRTTDGGRTWSVAAHTGAGTFLGLAYGTVAMAFRTPAQGWIAAVNVWQGPESVDVFRTGDGGLDWQQSRACAASRPRRHRHPSTRIRRPGGRHADCAAEIRGPDLRQHRRRRRLDSGHPGLHGGGPLGPRRAAGREHGAHGDLVFTNTGSKACLLEGLPTVLALIRADGNVLATRTLPAQGTVASLPLDPGGTGEMVVY